MFSYHKLLLINIIVIFFIVGCQTGDNYEEFSPVTPKVTSIRLQTLTPSKTTTSTKTITQVPTKNVSGTVESSSTPTATLESGFTRVSHRDQMVLVYIPAGEFSMGSSSDDPAADYDEIPKHLVHLDAFWIDQTVITNAMYAKFLNELGNQAESRTYWLDAGDEDVLIYQQQGKWYPFPGYEKHPVIEVSWYGARAYCEWVGRRLPTEAEWEKAARDSDDRIYPWGNEIDCDMAQYANCSGELIDVNSKLSGASPFGVLGLSGNTWEWTADWYAENYYDTSSYKNPIGPDVGETKTLRGGSWEYDWKHLRATNRRHNGPAVSMHDYSFRCVVNDDN